VTECYFHRCKLK